MYRGLKNSFVRNAECPICGSKAHSQDEDRIDMTLVICPICGKFRASFASSNYLASLQQSADASLYKVSHFTRTAAERGLGKRDNSLFPVYEPEDLSRVVGQPDPPVELKLQSLLQFIGTLSDYPGDTVEFDARHDYSVIAAGHADEALFYVRTLEEQGLLSLEERTFDDTAMPCTVTANGWLKLETLEQSGAESSNAFIAMWFDASRAPYETAINQAVRDAGYLPIRIDRVEHLNRIDDEIIARIRQSKFLVADFSGQRNGVYFEAGFMLGLGRPVIWACEKDELEKLHFDTRQYNMIDYANADDLRTRLQLRIEANLGRGPNVK